MSARRLLALVAVALATGAVSLTAARSPAGAVPTRASAPKLVTRNIHFYRTSIGGLVFFGEILYPYSSKQVVPPRKTAPFKASILGYTKKPAKIVVYARASTKGSNGFYLG